jgi:hypothetical protein
LAVNTGNHLNTKNILSARPSAEWLLDKQVLETIYDTKGYYTKENLRFRN